MSETNPDRSNPDEFDNEQNQSETILMKDTEERTRASKKSRSIRTNFSFEGTLSVEQVNSGLIKVFGSSFKEACSDSSVVSDFLSVKDLRGIIKNLKICEPTELFNYRKGMLCAMVQSHMLTDSMQQLYLNSEVIIDDQTIYNASPCNDLPIQSAEKSNIKCSNVGTSSILTIEDSKEALGYIQRTNQVIWQLSEKISELEKAISILVQRISEAEKRFNQ